MTELLFRTDPYRREARGQGRLGHLREPGAPGPGPGRPRGPVGMVAPGDERLARGEGGCAGAFQHMRLRAAPHFKPTQFAGTLPGLERLRGQCQCSGPHLQLVGKERTSAAASYPPALCELYVSAGTVS